MTTQMEFSDRNFDLQDGVERGVWGKLEYIEGAGATITVRGTGTVDEEAVVLNIGQAMNLPEDSNTEVFLLVSGSDTTQKYALLTIPRDKQRQWKENTGGIQNPTDPEKAVEFNEKRTHVTEDNFAVGPKGTIEVKDGVTYIRGDLVVAGVATVNGRVITPDVDPGTSPVPPFEA